MASLPEILDFTGARRLPVLLQCEAAECGLACLAMIAGWHGYETDLLSLRRKFSVSLAGTSAATLVDIAGKMNFGARAVRCELDDLSRLRSPCILHWKFDHFVVLSKVRGRRVWVHDPSIGRRILRMEEVSRCFTGVAIELVPTTKFEAKKERAPLKISQLWAWSPQLRTALVQGVVLSLCVQLFTILTPLYMQMVIDEGILKSDSNLLLGLAFAFGLLLIFNAVVNALRSWIFQFLGNVMSFDMAARLFHHMVRLPLEYFQNRSLGDLFQRFHSLAPIRQFVVGGAVGVVVDGTLAIITCILMFVYSPMLSAISVGVFVLYTSLRLGFMSVGLRYVADQNVADAREQGRFLETVRSMQTIKIAGGESNREMAWQNAFTDTLNAGIRLGRLGITFQLINTLLSSLSDVVVVYLAATYAIDGKMTIGVITAFMAYKGQFMSRMTSLVDQGVQFRMLSIPLERVADIALAEEEHGLDVEADTELEMVGEIAVRDLTFRYSPLDRPIVQNLNCLIMPRDFVAITGPSGEGKTTLLKLLLGLYVPQSGTIELDGRPLSSVGPVTLRRHIGVVMQEDQLLAGSIRENIAIFDDRSDYEFLRECAKLAQIDDEIMRLPMQYNTLVGDMGSSLSTGQRQRVLIARALYRKPKLLVLDEGTAHIDSVSERSLVQVLRQLTITRVVVAHSRAMIDAADRVFALKEGDMRELSSRERGLELPKPIVDRSDTPSIGKAGNFLMNGKLPPFPGRLA